MDKRGWGRLEMDKRHHRKGQGNAVRWRGMVEFVWILQREEMGSGEHADVKALHNGAYVQAYLHAPGGQGQEVRIVDVSLPCPVHLSYHKAIIAITRLI
jgi:hypothetical protein